MSYQKVIEIATGKMKKASVYSKGTGKWEYHVDRKEYSEKEFDKLYKQAEDTTTKYLDYTIHHCTNGDGMVLMKPDADNYEMHLGNFGEAEEEGNLDCIKKFALLHYMLARPEIFASSLALKLYQLNSGTQHEYYLLKRSLEKEGLEMPEEITDGDGMNMMIYFKGKPLTKTRD